MVRLVNIWTRPGLLGGARMGHSGCIYDNVAKAIEGRTVSPDPSANWELVGTFDLNALKFVSERDLKQM